MSKTANWKDEFDERFKAEWIVDSTFQNGEVKVVGQLADANEIKAFIESLLEKEREKWLVEKWKEFEDNNYPNGEEFFVEWVMKLAGDL